MLPRFGRAAALAALIVPGAAADRLSAQTPPPASHSAPAPHRPAGIPSCFQYKTLTPAEGQRYEYLLFVPPQYADDPKHLWPVIVCLHGSGECGSMIKMASRGLPAHVAAHTNNFPFIVIAPNAPTMWYRGPNAAAILEAMEAVRTEYRIDVDRVYLTGYSMGGFATWELAMARPDIFSAIVPICGIGSPEFASNIRDLPVWAFHGARDANVPVAGSRKPIEALKALGAKPKYTEFPDMGHEVWDRAYENREVYRWLLEHRRPSPPRRIDYRLIAPVGAAWWMSAEAEPGVKRPPHIMAAIEDGGKITIATEGVRSWLIAPKSPLVEIGADVEITWNGHKVYRGKYQGAFAMEPTTQPAGGAASRPTANLSEGATTKSDNR